ncbi:hypothetical protein Tco_0601364 [Tanacetum coccineum]
MMMAAATAVAVASVGGGYDRGGDDGGEERVVLSAVGGNHDGDEVMVEMCGGCGGDVDVVEVTEVMVSGDWWCGSDGGWPESGWDLAGKEMEAPKNYKEREGVKCVCDGYEK